ncbi:MAG: hypothetical protein HY275_02770 [Gemmatimonadetes bacterium]|nr:hypothetical protein [Gemmatimonadota bacterium]
MPVEFHVFPADSAKAAATLAVVPAILRYFDQQIGPYPFPDEKYAIAEFGRPSFREGQTITHLGPPLITGGAGAEQVVAHEIAHQWFGNALTVASWSDIWLNESLSEYMAWRWIRSARGDAAFRALVDSARVAPVAAPIVPASPADFNSLFGNATFQRGPAVLVKLEALIGSAAFESALRRYVHAHRHGVVRTADFQRACEEASGRPLDGFFADWVRGTRPL